MDPSRGQRLRVALTFAPIHAIATIATIAGLRPVTTAYGYSRILTLRPHVPNAPRTRRAACRSCHAGSSDTFAMHRAPYNICLFRTAVHLRALIQRHPCVTTFEPAPIRVSLRRHTPHNITTSKTAAASEWSQRPRRTLENPGHDFAEYGRIRAYLN